MMDIYFVEPFMYFYPVVPPADIALWSGIQSGTCWCIHVIHPQSATGSDETCWFTSPDSKVHGANMVPIWGRQDPDGPHVGPMNFAMWVS